MELDLGLYEILSPIVVLVITLISAYLVKMIHQKIGNTTLAGMLGRLNEIVWDEVEAAEQVMVKAIKAAKDPESDGGLKITPAEGEIIKKAVIDSIKENYGMAGLKKLGKILGLDDSGITKMIATKIEAAVLKVNP